MGPWTHFQVLNPARPQAPAYPHSRPFRHSVGTSQCQLLRGQQCTLLQANGGKAGGRHAIWSVPQEGSAGFLEEAAQPPEPAAEHGACARGRSLRPTFGGFQVPDTDGARLGAGHDELLGRVEADTLHWGRVTCQALWRERGNFNALWGHPPDFAPNSGSLGKALVRCCWRREAAPGHTQALLQTTSDGHLPQHPRLQDGQTPVTLQPLPWHGCHQ